PRPGLGPRTARSRRLEAHDIAQPHQGEQVSQLSACVAEPELSPVSASGELQSSQGIDRHGVRVDQRTQVADDETLVALIQQRPEARAQHRDVLDRKSTRLNSSHVAISYAVFCLKKKKNNNRSHGRE